MTLLSRLDALDAAHAADIDALGNQRKHDASKFPNAEPGFRFHLLACDAAPTLSAIARAAVARPWWRGGFEDDAGFDIWRCDGCDAPKDAPGDYAPHREPCRYSALDAAIDAAEGNA